MKTEDKRGRVIVMVGVSGSGKSTLAKEEALKRDNVVIHSSDELRMELFGELRQDKNATLFKVLHDRVFEDAKQEKVSILDATNLSLRRRMALFDRAKREGVELAVLVVQVPLEQALRQNALRPKAEQVPPSVIKQQYVSMQPPIEGVDCDFFYIHGERFFDREVLEYPFSSLHDLLPFVENEDILSEVIECFQPHETPYHLESIDSHIDMCIESSKSQGMKIVSLFHDLGKGIAKDKGRYIGHENIGAMYLLNAIFFSKQNSSGGEVSYDLVEVVLHHMKVNEGKIGERLVRRYSLPYDTVRAIELFHSNVDSPSRILSKT